MSKSYMEDGHALWEVCSFYCTLGDFRNTV